MKSVRRFLVRLVASITRRGDETRLQEEIEAHLALETEANRRPGMSPHKARRQAALAPA